MEILKTIAERLRPRSNPDPTPSKDRYLTLVAVGRKGLLRDQPAGMQRILDFMTGTDSKGNASREVPSRFRSFLDDGLASACGDRFRVVANGDHDVMVFMPDDCLDMRDAVGDYLSKCLANVAPQAQYAAVLEWGGGEPPRVVESLGEPDDAHPTVALGVVPTSEGPSYESKFHVRYEAKGAALGCSAGKVFFLGVAADRDAAFGEANAARRDFCGRRATPGFESDSPCLGRGVLEAAGFDPVSLEAECLPSP